MHQTQIVLADGSKAWLTGGQHHDCVAVRVGAEFNLDMAGRSEDSKKERAAITIPLFTTDLNIDEWCDPPLAPYGGSWRFAIEVDSNQRLVMLR
jgi:hypothetical protein